jgi:predicted dehydrogenase
MSEASAVAPPLRELRRPRLGFLGAGWIGRHRLRAIEASGVAEVAAIAEPAAAAVRELEGVAPAAPRLGSLEELLREPLDGVVIATPSALHAEQAITALESGLPVFCQKPLGRTAAETRKVIEAAKRANRLLGVDLSYRYTEALRVLRSVVQAGELGDVYAVDVVFHNAYGPDKSWARNPELAGGGCVIDLGVHMVDAALWTLGFPRVTKVTSRLYARGDLLRPGNTSVVEDYAVALIELDTGATVRLACSWNLSAGQDAVIEASFYGTDGGGTFRNVNGSFYDFTAELFRGTSRHTLASPPDEWGGRGAVEWAKRVARGDRYDPWIEGVIDVAAALDGVLGR